MRVTHPSSSPSGARRPRGRGVALLEVIVALALFVATAAIVTSSLSATLNSLDRQRRSTHAIDLAASVMAELQLGIRSPASGAGAQPFEPPFEQWTWELVVAPTENEIGETSSLSRVEIIVRHKNSETVRRLSQLIALDHTRRPSIPTPRI